MSMKSIRDYYKIPAKRGMRIEYDGCPADILSADRVNMHLWVRLWIDDATWCRVPIHPTWSVAYPEGAA